MLTTGTLNDEYFTQGKPFLSLYTEELRIFENSSVFGPRCIQSW